SRRFVPGTCLGGALLILLAFLTWQQTSEYRDLIALYTATLRKNPGCWMAHYNLGIVLTDQGDIDQAIDHYQHAVALRPAYAEAHYNLASALLRNGRTDEAIIHYQKLLQLYPENADAHANLGSAFVAKGGVRDALTEYTRAIEIAPENVAALSNLAWLLATSADPSLRNGAEAVQLAERADSASSRSDNHATVLRVLA